MLNELQVRDYALIADANLSFSEHCTVLTGETGAGKTAIIGALKLLMGERADSLSVRDGAEELRVSAFMSFAGSEDVGTDAGTEHQAAGGGELTAGGERDSDDEAAGDLQETAGARDSDDQNTDGELIVSRRVTKQGRSRASINDQPVTVGTLATRIGSRFELLSQHEHQSLFSPQAQLEYLDMFAGADAKQALAEYQTAYRLERDAAQALSALEQREHQSLHDIQEARFVLEQIDAVRPLPGEYEALEEQLPLLQNGEELMRGALAALAALRDEDGALDSIALALQALSLPADTDARARVLAERLAANQVELDDLASELRAYRDSVNFDAEALSLALDRLGSLEGLCKRFGPRMVDVFTLREQSAELLALEDELPARLSAALQSQQAAESALVQAAANLHSLRLSQATALEQRLTADLRDLAFADARIEARVLEQARELWSITGSDRFEFYYSPSAQVKARPLSQIASGGELSRVMLALKSELVGDAKVTLVFDEVDAGIGGKAALQVADYLRRLAESHQVIIITHLPQIAAIADKHYVVDKTTTKTGLISTSLQAVTASQRVAELARMLAGKVDELSLEHAGALLRSAQNARPS